jgi:type IV pilus assembly protein PilX
MEALYVGEFGAQRRFLIHQLRFSVKTHPQSQRGFVLVTSLIFLMVLSVLGVMAVRGSLFEERMAATDRDMGIARENAELALRDAERDILGVRFDGQYCAVVGCTTARPAGTRPVNAVDVRNFWIDGTPAVGEVGIEDGGIALPLAQQGVFTSSTTTACGMPVWSGANWNDGVPAPGRRCAGTIGAALQTIPYGTFTDAPFNVQGIPRPRYIIEMLNANGDMQVAQISLKLYFRVTAVGFGRTTGANGARTSVTLQSIFSPS